jgi:allantoinase
MIKLCEEYDCHVHIVHLSSADSIEQIEKARQRGLPLTVETAQHYLFFTAEEILDGQTEYKCAPPIREAHNNEHLWQALKNSVIDFVATDHSPATPDLKQIDTGNFTKAWGGIASIQFALPALWTAAKQRGCTLNDLTKWLCENPAKLIGKQHQKGKIKKGFDADLIILDAEKTFKVTQENIHHKHKITPYLNRQLNGVVEQTFIAGKKVYNDGTFIELNKGQIIYRN